jgi:hypothetical protein
MDPQHPAACLSCGLSEAEFPVLVLRLAGRELFICPRCLPALIHHPDRLTDRLIAAGWDGKTPPQGADAGH